MNVQQRYLHSKASLHLECVIYLHRIGFIEFMIRLYIANSIKTYCQVQRYWGSQDLFVYSPFIECRISEIIYDTSFGTVISEYKKSKLCFKSQYP